MKCPKCKREITSAYRIMVWEIGDLYPVSPEGVLDSNADPVGESVSKEFDDGSIPIAYECPHCGCELDLTED